MMDNLHINQIFYFGWITQILFYVAYYGKSNLM